MHRERCRPNGDVTARAGLSAENGSYERRTSSTRQPSLLDERLGARDARGPFTHPRLPERSSHLDSSVGNRDRHIRRTGTKARFREAVINIECERSGRHVRLQLERVLQRGLRFVGVLASSSDVGVEPLGSGGGAGRTSRTTARDGERTHTPPGGGPKAPSGSASVAASAVFSR